MAWDPVVAPGADGFTPFQRQTEAAFQALVPNAPLTRAGVREAFLTGPIPGSTAVVFIYLDGAEVSGGANSLRAERWDFETPDALMEACLASVKANVQSNQPLHPTTSGGPTAAVVAGERRS